MENGDSAEIAIIGNDGLVGVSVFMGGDSMSGWAVVQNAGECYRIKAEPDPARETAQAALSRPGREARILTSRSRSAVRNPSSTTG